MVTLTIGSLAIVLLGRTMANDCPHEASRDYYCKFFPVVKCTTYGDVDTCTKTGSNEVNYQYELFEYPDQKYFDGNSYQYAYETSEQFLMCYKAWICNWNIDTNECEAKNPVPYHAWVKFFAFTACGSPPGN
jgi:hypothetical protein